MRLLRFLLAAVLTLLPVGAYAQGGGAIGGGSAGSLTKIACNSPSGTATSSFTNIPQTYKNLMLIVYGRSTVAAAGGTQVNAQFNSDTGANYDHQYSYASNGGSANGNSGTGDTSAILGQISTAGNAANYTGAYTAIIYDYAGTTFYKQATWLTGVVFAASVGANMYDMRGTTWWRNTAAITSIDMVITGGNYAAGTSICLYAYQ